MSLVDPYSESLVDAQKRVTIVIPTFNDRPEHLRMSVASALAQSWGNVEVIVVDDGSTDPDTKQALLSLPREVKVLHQANGGVGSARNTGIQAATGEIIVCLDADDYLDGHYVREAVEVLAQPGTAVAFPFCVTFGAVVGEQPTAPQVEAVDALRGSGIFPPSAFRRSRWEEIGGFYTGDPAAQEDWEFWTRVLRDGGVARRVPSAVFHWRIRENSRSSLVHLEATRAAVVEMNRGHEAAMLRIALRGLDDAQTKIEVQKAELAVWRRRTAPFRTVAGHARAVMSGARARGAEVGRSPEAHTESVDGRGRFSVIIPTLQHSDDLGAIVEQCAAHPLVLEVIVINNASAPLAWESPKVRVLQQERNIYVNPAWNLGAREARGEFLAIVNDDVRFDDAAFDLAARGLRWFGVVGPDRSSFSLPGLERPRVCLARRSTTLFGFGTFMCLRRDAYLPIPEEMRIWGGDDWLILNQGRPPGALVGVPFSTEMGTTTHSPEAQKLRAEEQSIADRVLPPLEGARWWHRPLRGIEFLREVRHRMRTAGR